MPKIICTVPETTARERILQTEKAFSALYAEHFGSAKGLTILWVLSPDGQTFRAGQPADLYLTMIEVADGLDQLKRESALWAFTRAWSEILAVDIECLAVTVADRRTVAEFMQGNRNRLRPISRLGFVLSSVAHILKTRRRDGFAQLRVNL